MRKRCVVFSSTTNPVLPYFSALSHKRLIFRHRNYEMQDLCVVIIFTAFVFIFLIVREINLAVAINVSTSSPKMSAIRVRFKWNLKFCWQIFEKRRKISKSHVRPSSFVHANGRTDGHDEVNFTNAPADARLQRRFVPSHSTSQRPSLFPIFFPSFLSSTIFSSSSLSALFRSSNVCRSCNEPPPHLNTQANYPKSHPFLALLTLISKFRHIRAPAGVRRYAAQHGTVQFRNPLRRFGVPRYSLVTPTQPQVPHKTRPTEMSTVSHFVADKSLCVLTL